MILLREVFQKNGFPENFNGRCFKFFLNRIHMLKEKVPTVQKKPLQFVLPYFLILELYHCKLGLNCKSPSKGYFTAVNYRLYFKSQYKFCKKFCFKDPVPQLPTSGVFCKFQCNFAMNPNNENVLGTLL